VEFRECSPPHSARLGHLYVASFPLVGEQVINLQQFRLLRYATSCNIMKLDEHLATDDVAGLVKASSAIGFAARLETVQFQPAFAETCLSLFL
jgi:hypothetical protein